MREGGRSIGCFRHPVLQSSMKQSLLIAVVLLCACSCSALPDRPTLSEQEMLMPDGSARLDSLVGPEEPEQGERSGFRLVEHGPEALAFRVHASAMADRSIDVQTYIWRADLTGLYLANEVLLAADRGVRVRLLLDDLDARNNNYGFAALDAHPNIHVRLFNPAASRSGNWGLLGNLLSDGRRLNRRMHNKAWIVDNRIALGGGRNIGNEYFGASNEANFADLELVMAGPVVREANQSFDQFWNDEASYPIATLSPESANAQALQGIRETLIEAAHQALLTDYSALVTSENTIERLMSGDWALDWTKDYRLVSDHPSKVREKPEPGLSLVLAALMESLDNAKEAIRIVSPYFVPGREGSASLIEQAIRVDRVSILTNSLAANDVVAVHGKYSRYRKRLLAGGIGLYELKSAIGEDVERHFMPSSSASLHAKAVSIDDSGVFVGSYNLDPRSTSLNTEQGIFVRSTELGDAFNQQFDRILASSQTWELSLESSHLQWNDGQETKDKDPDTSFGRRFIAGLMRFLPIQSQL